MENMKNINLKFHKYSRELTTEEKFELNILLFDELFDQDLYILYINEDDAEIKRAILTLLSLRNNPDYFFIFIHELKNSNLKIRFISLLYLMSIDFFNQNSSLLTEYERFEKNVELQKIIQNLKNTSEKSETIKKTANSDLKHYILENMNNIDMHVQLKISFKMKNKTFSGKKDIIFKMLSKNSHVAVVKNLLSCLNTEKLDSSESELLLKILKEKIFYKELYYELKMLNLYNISKKEIITSYLRKYASLAVAMFK